MGTWSISGDSNASINPNTGKITFSSLSIVDRKYTVTYDDGSGNTTSQTFIRLGNSWQPHVDEWSHNIYTGDSQHIGDLNYNDDYDNEYNGWSNLANP